jgi:hypothetical protein
MAFWTILYSKTTMVPPRYHGLLDQAILKKRLRYTLVSMALWTKLYSKTTTVHPRYHGLLDQAIFKNDYGIPSFPWRFGPMFENDYGTHPLPWTFGPSYIRKRLRYTLVSMAFWTYVRKRLRYTPVSMAFWTYIRKLLRYILVSMAFWTYIRKRLWNTPVTMAFWTNLYSKTTTVHPRFHGVLDLYSKTTTVQPRYHGLLDQTIFENDYGTPSFPWHFGPMFENDYGTLSLPWPFGPNYVRKRLRYTLVTMAFWTKLYSKTTTVHTRYHGLLDQTIFENDYGTHPLPWPFGTNYIRKRLRYTPVTVAFWTKLFSKTTTVHTRYHGVLDQTKYLAINVSDNISWEKLTYT